MVGVFLFCAEVFVRETTLVKLVCPFDDCKDDFAQVRNVIRHCFRVHQKILPTKGNLKDKDVKPWNSKNVERYPTAPVKLGCVSCLATFSQKDQLKKHMEDTHLAFHEENRGGTVDRVDDWIIDGSNVSQGFRAYREHCLSNCAKYDSLDQHFNELLAMSSILFLQKRFEYETIPVEFISPASLKALHRQLAQQLSFRKTMEINLAMSIKDILVAFGDDEINSLEAQFRLLSLARTVEVPQQNVIRAIESLIPTWKDVDLQPLSEGHLIASYVHPLIQSLLAVDSSSKVSHCSNTQIVTDDLDQRPDYVVDVYQQYQFSYPSCFGEIKIKKTTDTLSMNDLYRLAVFGQSAIQKYHLNGILAFQTIGSSITFFYMKSLDGIHVFCEVSSVRIPTTKQNVTELVSYLDDLLTITCLHNNISKASGESTTNKIPILPMACVEGKKKSIPGKRRISVGSIARSSNKH